MDFWILQGVGLNVPHALPATQLAHAQTEELVLHLAHAQTEELWTLVSLSNTKGKVYCVSYLTSDAISTT